MLDFLINLCYSYWESKDDHSYYFSKKDMVANLKWVTEQKWAKEPTFEHMLTHCKPMREIAGYYRHHVVLTHTSEQEKLKQDLLGFYEKNQLHWILKKD